MSSITRLPKDTIVDATFIDAPSSTKNKEGKRDPEMHSVKKGSDWHFGMKARIGIDAGTGIVHSLVTTPANVHDLNMARFLLTGKEKVVWADAGYQGIEERDLGTPDVRFCIAMRKSKRKLLARDCPRESAEKLKSTVRARMRHAFLDFKRWFSYDKIRYRGLYKNTQRLLLAGLSNLLRAEKLLAA